MSFEEYTKPIYYNQQQRKALVPRSKVAKGIVQTVLEI